ncbi:MAG: YbaN family protein [Candidatus Kapaibacteriota bacterium]
MENKFNASSRTKRFVFIALGFFSLFLGIIGIFLPVLPTTPFLLLSASLFAKSSRKLYSWLLSTRTFGKIIRDYNEKKGVKLSIKSLRCPSFGFRFYSAQFSLSIQFISMFFFF